MGHCDAVLMGMQSQAPQANARPTMSTALATAAAASAGAGLVHAAAAGTHSGDATLSWLFATTAALGLGLVHEPPLHVLARLRHLTTS